MEKFGIGVGDDDGDLGGRVELAGPQGGADAGVAAADGDEVHGGSLGFVCHGDWTGTGLPVCRMVGLRGRARRGCRCLVRRSPRWAKMMSAASACVMPGYRPGSARRPATPPTICAAMKLGTEEGAMPAKVSENIRPMVMAGLAKLVELVKK